LLSGKGKVAEIYLLSGARKSLGSEYAGMWKITPGMIPIVLLKRVSNFYLSLYGHLLGYPLYLAGVVVSFCQSAHLISFLVFEGHKISVCNYQ